MREISQANLAIGHEHIECLCDLRLVKLPELLRQLRTRSREDVRWQEHRTCHMGR